MCVEGSCDGVLQVDETVAPGILQWILRQPDNHHPRPHRLRCSLRYVIHRGHGQNDLSYPGVPKKQNDVKTRAQKRLLLSLFDHSSFRLRGPAAGAAEAAEPAASWVRKH